MAQRIQGSRVGVVVLSGLIVVVGVYWIWGPSATDGKVPGPEEWFAEAYDLWPGEVVRFIPALSVPQRIERAGGRRMAQGWMLFYAGRSDNAWGRSSRPGTLYSALAGCGGLSPVEMDVPQELAEIAVNGDWTIRPTAAREQRIKGVESILRQYLGRAIAIEKRPVAKEVLVARGSYLFRPYKRSHPYAGRIHLFSDQFNRDPGGGGGGGTGTLDRLFKRIELATGRRLINEVQDAPERLTWLDHRSLKRVREYPGQLEMLLENLSKQTSLRFDREVRDVEVYFVREQVQGQAVGRESGGGERER